MMRSLSIAVVTLVVVNLLAVAALGGWLHTTGRLSRERVDKAVSLFTPTLEEEAAQAEQAAVAEEEAKAMAVQLARLEAVADGPMTTDDRLHQQQQRDELAEARVQRLQRDIADLQRQLEIAQAQIAKDRARLIEERTAFDEAVAAQQAAEQDENFQQAVRTYEQLKPRQVKQMFQTMMAEGRSDQVVSYLAAMQIRKSAGVLKEFKEEAEIAQATALIEALRKRGIDVAGNTAGTDVEG